MEQINHHHGGINIHFWNNYMTYETEGTFGAKPLVGGGQRGVLNNSRRRLIYQASHGR